MIYMVIFLLLISIGVNAYMILKTSKDNYNRIFKEILDKVSTNDLNYVDSSAINIIKVLKKYYKIDYCSILINEKNELKVIATDVNSVHVSNIEEHCSYLLNRTKGKAIIQSSESTCLDYKSAESRGIRYSYFLSLGSIGCIFIENKQEYSGNDFEVDFFKTIMKNIGIILQNCIYQDKIAALAMKDNLTGIYNRNYMNKHISKLNQDNKHFCIAIMDIDHFKSVNDTYGHDFGDVVLKEVSNFVRRRLEKNDEIYRWGGEEFVMIFIEQELDYIEGKLNNIREELSTYEIKHNNTSLKITASIGVAKYKIGSALEEELKKADKCLYFCKENGRNRVKVYR